MLKITSTRAKNQKPISTDGCTMVRIIRFSSRDVNSLSKFTHRFNSIFFKISATFLVDIGKFIFKCIWKDIDPRIDKTILETKGRIILANIKTQCVATTVRTV